MEDKDPQSKRQGFHNWTLFPQWQELHTSRLIAVTDCQTILNNSKSITVMFLHRILTFEDPIFISINIFS